MSNIQVIMQGILTATDATQSPAPYIANIDFENPTLSGTQYIYNPFFQAATSPGTAIPFTFNAFLIFVWNRGTQNVQVNLSVTGGPTAEAAVLAPNAILLLMDPNEAGPGWASVQLISASGTQPLTIFVAG